MKTLLLSLLSWTSIASAALEITISPSSGPNSGLSAARDAIRELRKAGETGPAAVILKEGTYEISAPLILEPQDSGLTLRAAEGARPKLYGGTIVSGFAPHTGAIVKADVSAWVKPGTKLRQLIFADERMILARYPNHDPANPLYGGWAFVDAFPRTEIPGGHDLKGGFFLKPGDVRRWAHPEDLEIDLFPYYGWWNFIMPVASVDGETRQLTFAKPCGYAVHPMNRFHIQNALEELDSPGEWFLDPRNSVLYFWPPTPLEGKVVRLITLEGFLQVKEGAKNIRIERLSFSGCNGTALSFSRTEDCLVAGCTFTTTGHINGSTIGFGGGKNNIARSNDISLAGGNGISLTGGDRTTLTPANNQAINNHIHHFGVFNKNACGVGATGAGLTVAHNEIAYGPRMGVQMSGNNITIEHNHLHHLCLETQDGAAVYTGGRDWLGGRGNIWSYNRIHDIIGCGQEADGLKVPWFTFGLYPDDNSGGIDIIGNLIYRAAHTAIHFHNSRDCRVENNVFAFCGAYQFDLHGWRKEHSFYASHLPTMIAGYESVAGQPAWSKMRGMELHPKDAIREDGTMMSGNIIERNIILSDSPGVKYCDLRNVSPKWNTIDRNLAWNGGHPIVTGLNQFGPDKGEPILVETFSSAEAGKTPRGWGFNHRANPEVKLIAVDGALQADCAVGSDPANSHTVFRGPDVPVKPGGAFRVRLRVKATEPTSQIGLALAIYKGGEGYWQSKSTPFIATPEWQEIEAGGVIPKEDAPAWKPWMTAFWLRIDCRDGKGKVLIDDVRIFETEAMNEWASWQAEGWDRHGIVADPLFEDVTKDDYRLKPESPAITQLGFKPLPIDQMGMIEDEWRKLP